MSQSVITVLSWSKEGLRLALMCRSRASSGMKISEVSKQLKGQLKLEIMVMIAGPFTTVSCHGKNTNWREEVNIRWFPMDIQMFVQQVCLWSVLSQKISSWICPYLKNAFFVFYVLAILYYQSYFGSTPLVLITQSEHRKHKVSPRFAKFWQVLLTLRFWFDHNLSLTFIDWGQSWF